MRKRRAEETRTPMATITDIVAGLVRVGRSRVDHLAIPAQETKSPNTYLITVLFPQPCRASSARQYDPSLLMLTLAAVGRRYVAKVFV